MDDGMTSQDLRDTLFEELLRITNESIGDDSAFDVKVTRGEDGESITVTWTPPNSPTFGDDFGGGPPK